MSTFGNSAADSWGGQFNTDAGRLGGTMGGTPTDPYALTDDMRKRYGMLGQAVATPGLTPWLTGQRDTTGGWVGQSRGSQQDAFNIANAMGLGGQTPQQQMLMDNYIAQNAGVQGAAMGAGGGARGAAAAQGNAYGALGMNAAQQGAGMQLQQQQDQMQGQALAAQAANALRAGDQGAMDNQNARAIQDANFQQGWSQNNWDQALWAQGMDQKARLGALGLTSEATDRAISRQDAERALSQQYLGTGLQAGGAALTAGQTYAANAKKNPDW